MMKNKKVIATIATSALLILGGTTAFFMTADKPEGTDDSKFVQTLEVTVKEKVEYGSDLSEKTFVVNTVSGEKEVKFTELTPAVDTSKVGKTTHELTVEKEKFEVEVTVADTVKPEIFGIQEKFEFEAETNIEAELKKTITAKDPVDGELEVTFEITAKENSQNGFDVVAKATDKNDNTTSEKFEVVVKEKVVVNEPINSGETTSPENNEKPAVQAPAQKPATQTPAQKPATQTPAQKPATQTPPAQKPAETKPSNPSPSQPSTGGSTEGVSAQYPNGTVTKVGSVPSGASPTHQNPDGFIYKFNKTLPSGSKIQTVSVAAGSGKELLVTVRALDNNNVMGIVNLHQDGAISYSLGYPTLTDEDMAVIRSIESQFRAAFKHIK